MIKRLILLALMGLTKLCVNAQMADLTTHQNMADSIVNRFNRKDFEGIYNLNTPEFKEAVKSQKLADLLEKNLYNAHGRILSKNYLREDTGYHVFILNFNSAKVKMNLGVNTDFEIAFFQLLPYKEPRTGKRLDYLSDNQLKSELDSVVEKAVKTYMQSPQNCGLSLAVYAKGKTRYYNYGETKRDSKTRPNQNSIYEIGSITKTFCGLLYANAVLEGKLKPDDDICNYLPGKFSNLNYNGNPIRLRHLANHTAALPRLPENLDTQPDFDDQNPYKNYSRQMVLDYLKTVKPTFEPGLICEYSNYGMALLGLILERVYQKSFEELVKEKIALPIGLTNTGIQLTVEQQKLFTEGYTDDGDSTPHWELGGLPAAGALRSTSADMMRYLTYNLNEKDSVTKLAHRSTFKGRENVAMAWFLKETIMGNHLIWHNGGTYGYSSFGGFIKEKNCALIILSNSGTNVDYIGIAILNYLQQ
ncbi:MAG: beta-lactamase family protein [Bacteroidia bacterium]|nr:beta-lactamase family protein [Bacteroidia bacterium]